MASNNEIIYKAVTESGMLTTAEADNLIMKFGELPLHTFIEWKRRGYSVKKGEKARLHLYLWMFTNKPNKAAREEAAEAGEEIGDDPHYYKKLSHLFALDQVERTEDRKQAAPVPVPAAAPAALEVDADDQMMIQL